MNDRRPELLRLLDCAIRATHPEFCLPKYCPKIPEKGRLIVLGAGKGAAAMALAVEKTLIARGVDLKADRVSGTIATRHGYGLKTEIIEIQEAGHPVPDEASMKAAQTALTKASEAGPDDLVLVLLTGGASAIWSAPLGGITLAEKQELTASLLRSGMPISSINIIRKHLSSIKAGGLARAAHPAELLTLAISDIPGDVISAIGSGPTIGDETTLQEARAAIAQYDIELTDQMRNALADPANETPFPDDEIFDRCRFELIATARHALDAAAIEVEKMGYKPTVLGDALEGEARDLAKEHAALALEKKRTGERCALISGGECTVTVTGTGIGGPNQEYALALAMALKGEAGISALAADTDGTDGGRGDKNDPAGAIVTPTTLKRAEKSDLNPAIFLANNDTGTFFRRVDDLIIIGPTQTNVNDFRIILIDP